MSRLTGNYANVYEHSGVIDGSCAHTPQNLWQAFLYIPVKSFHLLNRRLPAWSDKSTTKLPKYASHRRTMDIRVGAIQITQRFCESAIPAFVHEPGVFPIPYPLPRHAESEFERHVETWSRRAFPIEFDSRKVVNRKRTVPDQPKNSVQAPASTGNLQGRPRHKPERTNPADVGYTKVLKFIVVGNIQEYFIGRPWRSWHAFASLMFFVSGSPLFSIACSRSSF
jgi:hypothetical protein